MDPTLTYFQGHFPNAPVLPGVAQLDFAVKIAKRHLGFPKQLQIDKVEVLKFQQVILPEQKVTLQIIKKSPLKFAFSYTSANQKHASGRIVFGEIS